MMILWQTSYIICLKNKALLIVARRCKKEYII
jgi:hypothetical protein